MRKRKPGMHAWVMTAALLAIWFYPAHMSMGNEPVTPQEQLKKAIISGDWKGLASLTSDDAIGHFGRSIANGVMGNYRIMFEECAKASKDGLGTIDKLCAELVSQAPTNGYVRFVNGVRLYDRGDKAAGVAEFHKAIAFNPKFAAAYAQLGLHYGKETGNWSEQESWCDKAIQADASYAAAYSIKGEALMHSGRKDAARTQYAKVIEILTSAGVKTGQPLAQAYYNLGWLHLNGQPQNNDEAMKLLKLAIEADPLTLETYTELGIAYKRKGQFSDAVRTYKKGIELGSNDATIYFNLGVSEFRNGNSKAAKSAFQTAISRDPDGQMGQMARQWLSQVQ